MDGTCGFYFFICIHLHIYIYLHNYIKSISITLTLLFWLCMNTYISVAHASSRDETGGLHALWTSHVYWTEEHQGDAPRLASSAVTIPSGVGMACRGHALLFEKCLMIPWQSLTWRWDTWDVSFGMSRLCLFLITPKSPNCELRISFLNIRVRPFTIGNQQPCIMFAFTFMHVY